VRGSAALAVVLLALTASPASACRSVVVPGAEMQKSACLDDLTTTGTTANGHTDPSDWGALDAAGVQNPSGVPGVQVDGYFPDTSTINNDNGWHHDSQFVLRVPDRWNGRLVVSGATGVLKQYSNDHDIGDWVLGQGFAFASTDRGNSGTAFYQDGNQTGDAIAEWNTRVTQLTQAAQAVLHPSRTYIAGVSNGGYLTRWQLENHPELYDGGVDWEGTLFTDTANLFTYLPVALRNYPKWRDTGDQAAHDAMIKAGFAPGSEFLWDLHYGEFWDITQRVYREEFDPGYDGALQAGIPYCQPGTPDCDADYDWSRAPASAHAALAKVALTGRIGKPMITLHGTLDSLLPIATDSDVYERMVDAAGRGALHRYYVVQDGNHVDANYDGWPDRLRPILPCFRQAFVALQAWAEHGVRPPDSQLVPDPHAGDVVNTCALARGAEVPGPGPAAPSPAAAPAKRAHPRGLTVHVRRAYRVSGRVLLPAGLKAAQACGSGVVAVSAKSGARTVSTRVTRLRADCRYAVRVRFAHRPRHLRFRARFFGNRALYGT
jgi:hypothetical protein